MPVYKVTETSFEALDQTSFEREGILERQGIQARLRDYPEVLEEGLFILAEEFSSWDESSRRIDLLALDRGAVWSSWSSSAATRTASWTAGHPRCCPGQEEGLRRGTQARPDRGRGEAGLGRADRRSWTPPLHGPRPPGGGLTRGTRLQNRRGGP